MNRIQQILIPEWLSQELDSSAFMARTDIGMSPCPVIKDDRNRNVGLGQLALKIEPTDSWQPDIEDKATGSIRPFPL
jgi:hypothetical protein